MGGGAPARIFITSFDMRNKNTTSFAKKNVLLHNWYLIHCSDLTVLSILIPRVPMYMTYSQRREFPLFLIGLNLFVRNGWLYDGANGG